MPVSDGFHLLVTKRLLANTAVTVNCLRGAVTVNRVAFTR